MPSTDKEDILNLQKTTSSGVSLAFKAFLNRHILQEAEKKLIFHQFGETVKIPKGKGKTITWLKMSPLPPAMTPLVEGITPVGNHLHLSEITASPTQHGDYTALTDQFQFFRADGNPSPEALQINEGLADQAGRTLNNLTQAVLAAGTNVVYAQGSAISAPNARSGLGVANTMTVRDLRRAVLALKKNNAKPFGDGSYVAIAHPDVIFDLQDDDNWLDVKTYQDKNGIYTGEVGKLFGVRFIEDNEIIPFLGSDLLAPDSTNGVNGSKTLQIEKIDGTKVYVHETISSTQASALASRKVEAGGVIATVSSATAGTNGAAYLTLSATAPALWHVDTVLYPGEGASSSTGGATARPVYPTFVIAKGAYGVSDPKGTLQTITKTLGDAGVSDPLDQRCSMGWKTYHVAKILVDEYMVRIESVATNLY